MEKVKEFLRKIPDWVKAVVASAVIIAVAVVVNDVVQKNIIVWKHKEIIEVTEDNFSYVFQIDDMDIVDGDVIIEGWIFKPDEDSIEDKFEIVLYDYNQDIFYRPKMESVVREDVNNYFLCDYDYSNSGFKAIIKAKKLELEGVNYEVLIQRIDSRSAFSTGVYISNGVLMHVKPEKYKSPNVKGTVIEQVVDNGVVRVYRPDEGIYVYQYEEKFYWIADEKYKFEESRLTMLEYIVDTTQPKNLPQRRVESGLDWDNRGFLF